MIDLKGNPFFLKDSDIQWVRNTLTSMTLEEKVGQLFCVLFRKTEAEELEEIYSILKPGGCMYRCVPMEKAVRFGNLLREKAEIPLLLAANLEKGGNGIVEEGTLMGSPMEIAATDDVGMAEKMAVVCVEEGAAVGANWAFAPIIDIDDNFRNPITNTRTFGSSTDRVREMGLAYVNAVQSRGMAASIKHFPGDGQDERDQHLVTSINSKSCEDWEAAYAPSQATEGKTPKTTEVVGVYDLILYVANLATKSNQTSVRIEWAQPMGANCGHFINDVPTVFVSLENPYHLLDFPRVKTFINCYSNNDSVIDALVEKLTGRSPFFGVSPVDPFCGKWDTHL